MVLTLKHYLAQRLKARFRMAVPESQRDIRERHERNRVMCADPVLRERRADFDWKPDGPHSAA